MERKRNGSIRVHYVGYEPKYDEWLPPDSPRLRSVAVSSEHASSEQLAPSAPAPSPPTVAAPPAAVTAAGKGEAEKARQETGARERGRGRGGEAERAIGWHEALSLVEKRLQKVLGVVTDGEKRAALTKEE
eukprot:2765019-Rhodomonas_salina.1